MLTNSDPGPAIVTVKEVIEVSATTTCLASAVKIALATAITTSTAQILFEDFRGRPVILEPSKVRMKFASL